MTSISRITHRSMGHTALSNLQGNLSRLGKLQDKLSSGKQIARPSDSPSGTVSAMEIRGQLRANAQYSRNADDGLGWLSTLDTAMTSSLTTIGRVRDLTLQGMSTGSGSDSSREAMAAEMDNLRESLVGLANTTYLDRPVFGGATSGQTAYSSAGTYQGDGTQVHRTVGDNASVRVDLTGPEAFGTGAGNLFAIVADISAHLRSDPSRLGADLDRLDAARRQLLSAVSGVGARQARVEHLRAQADDRGVTLTSGLAEIESIDLPATIVELQMQQSAYQAALGATSKVVQPSLVDFLH
jgi:flagellar hook-associated protein 3 FlgL